MRVCVACVLVSFVLFCGSAAAAAAVAAAALVEVVLLLCALSSLFRIFVFFSPTEHTEEAVMVHSSSSMDINSSNKQCTYSLLGWKSVQIET